jgi:hypothetical protein
MTSNTVEIESHPVNFPSFSVEKRTYKPDPFTVKVPASSVAEFHDSAFVHEFVNFVRQEDANALPTLEAIMTTGTRGEAAYWLGVAELEFDRMNTRVRHLARCFVSGETVPKQRKPYKRRGDSLRSEVVT